MFFKKTNPPGIPAAEEDDLVVTARAEFDRLEAAISACEARKSVAEKRVADLAAKVGEVAFDSGGKAVAGLAHDLAEAQAAVHVESEAIGVGQRRLAAARQAILAAHIAVRKSKIELLEREIEQTEAAIGPLLRELSNLDGEIEFTSCILMAQRVGTWYGGRLFPGGIAVPPVATDPYLAPYAEASPDPLSGALAVPKVRRFRNEIVRIKQEILRLESGEIQISADGSLGNPAPPTPAHAGRVYGPNGEVTTNGGR